jgi:hypothetical protein
MRAVVAHAPVTGDDDIVGGEARQRVALAKGRQPRQLRLQFQRQLAQRRFDIDRKPGCTDGSRWRSIWRLNSRRNAATFSGSRLIPAAPG